MQWLIDIIWEKCKEYIDTLWSNWTGTFTGIIVAWSGTAVDIPSGWTLCDGTNGTPNLQAKFIIGSHFLYPKGSTGGATSHVHDFTGNGHDHMILPGIGIQSVGGLDLKTGPANATGTTNVGMNMPPYYSLCYIMKI